MKHKWRRVIIGCMVVLGCVIAVFSAANPSYPVTVSIIGQTNLLGGPQWLFEVRNNAVRREFDVSFKTEALTDGTWVRAKTQHPEADFAFRLLPKRSARFAFLPPGEGSAWRVVLDSQAAGDGLAERVRSFLLGLTVTMRVHRFINLSPKPNLIPSNEIETSPNQALNRTAAVAPSANLAHLCAAVG